MNNYPGFSVLMVDDEPGWLRSMENILHSLTGINNVITCADASKVMDILAQNDVGLILLDVVMPGLRGDDLLSSIVARYPDLPVIMLTGLNDVNDAMQCLTAGAYDYYVKTWGENRLATGVYNAVRMVEKEHESRKMGHYLLSRDLVHPEAFAETLTLNSQMYRVFKYIEAISQSRLPVLITGESGVGKELIARSVHTLSGRSNPMVSLNMASLSGQMLDDALFGHAKGAYTNAESARRGLIEQAAYGSLFLDEIGELDSPSQAKLLRLVQEGEYYQLGSDRLRKSEARLILATNHDLTESIKTGAFRSDLYYRLITHHIQVPPLRERKEDIPLLVRQFVRQSAQEMNLKPPAVSNELILELCRYDYPGNIRELQAIIFNAVSLGRRELSKADFPALAGQQPLEHEERHLLQIFMEMDTMPSFADVKKIMTNAALARTGGNQTAAARILGISQPALSMRIKN